MLRICHMYWGGNRTRMLLVLRKTSRRLGTGVHRRIPNADVKSVSLRNWCRMSGRNAHDGVLSSVREKVRTTTSTVESQQFENNENSWH